MKITLHIAEGKPAIATPRNRGKCCGIVERQILKAKQPIAYAGVTMDENQEICTADSDGKLTCKKTNSPNPNFSFKLEQTSDLTAHVEVNKDGKVLKCTMSKENPFGFGDPEACTVLQKEVVKRNLVDTTASSILGINE